MKKKRILVCPLDWGIGHAGRDVIVISKLLEKGTEPILGGFGPSLRFLTNEFPQLEVVQIPSHRFIYSKRFPAWFMIMLQIPAFLKGILDEHRSLGKIIDSYRIDFVISDARYGLWNPKIPCAIICHPVRIPMPLLFKPLEFLITSLNRVALQKFSCHWIPDGGDDRNLSGTLSHKIRITPKSTYVGCLSRFTDYRQDIIINEYFEIVVLLSGPEPQRSVFEKLVAGQLGGQNMKSLIIGGLPEESYKEIQDISPLCKRKSFVSGSELYSLLLSAKYIICRSGYSTIMDLAAIGKIAFLVPTPGQGEQEYLASYLQHKGLFCYSEQKNFNLENAIKRIDSLGVPDFSFVKNKLLDSALENFISYRTGN